VPPARGAGRSTGPIVGWCVQKLQGLSIANQESQESIALYHTEYPRCLPLCQQFSIMARRIIQLQLLVGAVAGAEMTTIRTIGDVMNEVRVQCCMFLSHRLVVPSSNP
jgi:hypothetical protein